MRFLPTLYIIEMGIYGASAENVEDPRTISMEGYHLQRSLDKETDNSRFECLCSSACAQVCGNPSSVPRMRKGCRGRRKKIDRKQQRSKNSV